MVVLSSAARVAQPGFLLAGALVALGTVGAEMVAEYARANVYDIDVAGDGAIYALAGAAGTFVLGSALGLGRVSQNLALGMVAKAALTTKREVLD